jgi:dipeptide transport system ATP-binding protein
MPLLDVDRLTTAFPIEGREVPAVSEVSFSLAASETVALVGESGCGKSLTALSILRLVDPPGRIVSGSVRLEGRDLLTLAEREMRSVRGREIGLVLQEPMTALNPVYTVGSQIAEALEVHGLAGGKVARARAVELLEAVRVPEPQRRVHDYPHQLSGGLRQRALIAAALACQPKLLIADEPTTALDVTIQAQILDLLLKLQQDTGMALVLITHDMGVVAETAQRVSVQYAGQKVEEQPVHDLFADPHHPYTAALLAALPERAKERRLPSIRGVVPGQFDRPPGCLFAPRCRFATTLCTDAVPPRQPADLGQALCHYPLRDGEPMNHPGTEEAA